MSFRFGLTGTFGHYVGKALWGAAGFALSAGVLRAGYVELQQESGFLPEDGRGFLLNVPVQALNNVRDAIRIISYINDQTSSADEIYFEQTPDGKIKLVDSLMGTDGEKIEIPKGSQIIAIDRAVFEQEMNRHVIANAEAELQNEGLA